MLADPRSEALVDNFASQWLTLGKLAGVVPDVDAYPEFDENLRDALRQETRLFVGSQLREDRSVGRAADGQLHLSSTSGSRVTTRSRTSTAATSGA